MKYATSTLMAMVMGILIIPIVALGATTQSASAFSRLQTGTWTIHANGFDGDLKINSVAGGVVKGTVTFQGEQPQKIIGAYDQNLQKIWFVRIIKQNDPTANQYYTGYLFKESSFGSSGTADVMTGYFEHTNGIRYYGWYATR